MAQILQFLSSAAFQAHLPRDEGWWVNPKLFADRTHVECITRPTEQKALLHLWLEARALRHYLSYRTILTPVERRAKDLELEALRTPTLRGLTLYQYVARRLSSPGDEWSWRRAQGILEDVTMVLRHAELERVLELKAKAEKRQSAVFKQIVQEAMREGVEDVSRAA